MQYSVTVNNARLDVVETASIGDAATGAWTAWGGSWGDSWGLSWGVFEQPYTQLKLGQQIFVLTELAKHYAISVSSQIIAFAEKHEVSVLTAMASLNVCTQELRITATQHEHGITSTSTQPSLTTEKDKPARCDIRSTPERIDVAVRPSEMYVVQKTASSQFVQTRPREVVARRQRAAR